MNQEINLESSFHDDSVECVEQLDVEESQSSKVHARLLVGGALAVAAVCIGVFSVQFGWFSDAPEQASESAGPPPAAVAVASAKEMTMAPHTLLPGSVVSVRDAVVASETSGKVLRVALVGEVVEQGQSIAEIDPQNARQLLAQRRAELKRLQSLLQYHKDYYARVNIEEEKLGIPEIGVAELRSNMETAEADVDSAKAALTSAENDLERTSIKAPFPGRIVSQSIQPGEFAQVGSSVARLVDTTNLEVSARVPAALVQPIETGTLLEVSGMGKVVTAPMRALVPVGDAVSRTMELRELRVALSEAGFLVGSPVRVSLPSAEPKKVVAIPRDAVILRTDAKYVFVVDAQGKAHRRDVQLGYAEGDMIEVIGDVKVDATVIIRGGERLRDGQQVAWSSDTTDSSAETVSIAKK